MNVKILTFDNPFKPGAGHMPPYLAGREREQQEFARLLDQTTILENLVLTGLRGVGKTVLLETFKPIALERGWRWCGADLSESASATEVKLATRLLTDLSVVTSAVALRKESRNPTGFSKGSPETQVMDFKFLMSVYEQTPGLVEDKIKAVLEFAWAHLKNLGVPGVIFAYDEAQNLADAAPANEFPLSILLDVFQSIQKKGIPFMLALTGLPTLFPKLVEARTYAERMFRVIMLSKLDENDSRDAIVKPIQANQCPVTFSHDSVELIIGESGGYPYFIQFICREVYDLFIQQARSGGGPQAVPVDAITRKLDSDFFAGRWAKCSDRQRELLWVIARTLVHSDDEFTVQDVVSTARQELPKPFSSSHANQILAALGTKGLVYKNRHGRYSLAVPLLDRFILRQVDPQDFAQRD